MTGSLALIVLAVVLAVVLATIVQELRRRRRDAALQHVLTLFGGALAAVQQDPRELLVWQPLSVTCRRLFPDAFAELDRAAGGTFPFASDHLEAAHARWTTDWLSWERAHDFEYKLKASVAEADLERSGEAGTSVGRARVEQIQREQLERYQARYEEYVRVAKAFKHLEGPARSGRPSE